MELPLEVLIHNELVGMKGTHGTLLEVREDSYEVICVFGDKRHRVLLPIAATVLIHREPEEVVDVIEEVER